MNQEKKYFIALTGAKKNAGDFLITDRALKLLKTHLEYDFHILPHWKTFDDLEFINNSQGIIILGGPGIVRHLYPKVYKLTENLSDIKVPIFLLGGGWKADSSNSILRNSYRFSQPARRVLNLINSTNAGISCRGFYSYNVLKRAGFDNVTMTGCPAWYDLSSIGKDFHAPNKIKKVIFTPAQLPEYCGQSIKVMRLLKKRYSDCEIVVSFHRGIDVKDEFSPQSQIDNNIKLCAEAKALGFKCVDISGTVDKFSIYDDFDLHIGYRVHAHIYFLSKRKVSVLINEDARGNEVSNVFDLDNINGYFLPATTNKLFRFSFFKSILSSTYKWILTNNFVDKKLEKVLSKIEKNNFNDYNRAVKRIDETYKDMSSYISKIACK